MIGLLSGDRVLILLVVFSLGGCGGSRESSIENTPPTVEIEPISFFYPVTDRVNPSLREIVVEAASNDVDGSINKTQWSILSNHQIDLIDVDTNIIRFNAPLIDSEETDLLILEVEVTDNQGSKTSDTVKIDLNDDLVIDIPLVSGKRGEEIAVNALIFGRQSKVAGFSWTISNGVEVTLLDAMTDTVTFLAPNSSTISEVNLELEISYMDDSDAQTFNAFVTLHD